MDNDPHWVAIRVKAFDITVALPKFRFDIS